MANYYNIAFIGSGNLPWHLAPELENAGHRVVEVYSQTIKKAQRLQNRLYKAEINASLDFSSSEATIFFISVSDDAIEEIAQEVALPKNAIIIHTSGSKSIKNLAITSTENIGVFYPLQTFTKRKKISFDDVPILIESENTYTSKVLKSLGNSISKSVVQVSSKERMAIHIAAVFACNFTNYMFEISEDILKQKGMKLDLLHPLIVETINKSLELGPQKAQTGPAIRGDLQTLDNHMEFLKKSKYREVYKLITKKILNG